jgi:hypothetical protein
MPRDARNCLANSPVSPPISQECPIFHRPGASIAANTGSAPPVRRAIMLHLQNSLARQRAI